MKYCLSCQKVNKESAKFCKYCGTGLEEREVDALFKPKKKSNTLRNIIIGVIALFIIMVLIGASSDTGTQTGNNNQNQEEKGNGMSFTSVEHGFKIRFPTYPSTERIKPETLDNGVTYSGIQYLSSTRNDQDIYLAQAADYDVTPSDFDNKTGLEGMLNGIAVAKDYDITNSYFTKFQNYDALEFIGTFDSGNYFVKGIGFVRDDLENVKAFILMVASKDDSNYENYFDDFINSFSFN
ncbi:MAG: zinc ribbon domain-containing protein [Candidatus Levybacteria bacterium]|nr:zinc ribbon domain-containing protein [Candidatus Levybacteria bacterium]